MLSAHRRSTTLATALLASTWTLVAAAEPHSSSNQASTPRPAQAAPSEASPIVSTPLTSVETERSSLPNAPLFWTGTLVLGTSYGGSVVGAALSDREAYDELYYPVVGPWMALNDLDCDTNPCGSETLSTTLLIGSGVLQGVGALGMVMSLFIPNETTRTWYLLGNDDFVVAPVMNANEVGAAAVGRF